MNGKLNEKEVKGGYGRVVKYLGMFGGAQVISTFINLLRNKVASTLLGAVGIGLISMYTRTVQMFSDCTNLSLSLSAVRKLSATYENGNSDEVLYYVKVTRSVALLTGLIGMFLFLFLSPLVAGFFDDNIGFSHLYLVMLSPVLLFLSISSGEVAILRGVRRLNVLAIYALWTSAVALLVAVPMYCLLGYAGIVPSIFLIALLQMAGVLYHTLKSYKYKVSPFSFRLLRDGVDMLKLGAGYIYSTILVSCSVWLIYERISTLGGESELGLFSTGYLILTMFPSVLFAALDSEYYPRLSGAFADKRARNSIVNEQIEVHTLIQIPAILCVIMLLPYLLPLISSNDFMPAVRMTQLAMFGLIFHILTYPISFMPLSKGDTKLFIVQETVYNVANVVLVVWGYMNYGLNGAGAAILLVRVIDFLTTFSISHFKYGFNLSKLAIKNILLNGLFVLTVMFSLFALDGYLSWIVGGLAVLLSGGFSLYSLMRYGELVNKIKKRLNFMK